jgi:hypothetical protein
MVLNIQGPQKIAQVEAALCQLHDLRPKELRLPVRPKDWWLGGEHGLIQLAITWARLNYESRLLTHIAEEEDPAVQLRSMARRIYGFVALMMASEILDRSGQRSVRSEAHQQCRSVVEMMFRPINEFAIGPRIFLICVDHSRKRKLPALYSSDGSVCDRFQFKTLVSDLLNRLSKLNKHDPVPEQMLMPLAAILHELFKNTDEWASCDENGSPWRRSVRGITAERHSWTVEQLSHISDKNSALTTYFASFSGESGARRLSFIEFSVFDSGIGLARQQMRGRWSDNTLIGDEYLACLDCLKKHRTSSTRTDRGLGLAEVMSTLACLGSFLRVRTGRLSLYRDFRTQPFATGDDRLFDFTTCTDVPVPLAPVYGTQFQILIPLSEAK